MKDFINLSELMKEVAIKRKGLLSWIDRLKFTHILLIWLSIVILFGLAYHLLGGADSYLHYTISNSVVTKLSDAVYFSFIAATTTGFGDILPIGYFKMISILEVICGLIILALVTSKLVSIRQDMILNEIYEISFNEKINRLRSTLLLFRQNLSRLMGKVDEGTAKKREVAEIYMHISSLEDVLNEISSMNEKSLGHHFAKTMDHVNSELILISITNSFERLHELIICLNEKQLEWKRDVTIKLIERCIQQSKSLFKSFAASKTVGEEIMAEMNAAHTKIISALKKDISSKSAVKTVKKKSK